MSLLEVDRLHVCYGSASRMSETSEVTTATPGFVSGVQPYFEGSAGQTLRFTGSK